MSVWISFPKRHLSGRDALRDYLMGTAYAEGAAGTSENLHPHLNGGATTGSSRRSSPQKYNAFSVGPVIAYVIARQNEIKTVRIILTGKQNDLPDDSIRERVREMYV